MLSVNGKPWYTSRAIWGGILAMLAPVLALAGYQVTEADQHEIINLLVAVAEAVAGMMAIVGRVGATSVIKRKPGAPEVVAESTGSANYKPWLPAVLLIAMLAAAGPIACASVEARTPAQHVYAIESDLLVPLSAARAYVTRADADPDAKATIKRLVAGVDDAVTAAQVAARAGDDPTLPAALAAARAVGAELLAYLKLKGVM
ncbi:MAG TPA: hypothetical protein VLL76_03670 [Candidatus Omnitrophota bacterium]|nr:hypothetical protein [Candidatus Omnitrophota bacterium]